VIRSHDPTPEPTILLRELLPYYCTEAGIPLRPETKLDREDLMTQLRKAAKDVTTKPDANAEKILTLLGQFADTDESREKAHLELLRMGNSASEPLTRALKSPNRWIRWEAARALRRAADPSTATALAEALEDKDFDVRWVAADALVVLDHEGLVALLKALIRLDNTPWMREAAHYVLRHESHKGLVNALRPLHEALNDTNSNIKVPIAAEMALQAISKAESI
jgi:HEAT repeat protein